jgi:hypothetical protein
MGGMAPLARRSVIALSVLVLVAACNEPVRPSPTILPAETAASAAPSPTEAPSPTVAPATPSAEPSEAPVTGEDTSPPACLEAVLAWDPGSDRLLLLNCVDQFDQASTEQVWSWDGAAWSQVSAGGPPATVVTGVAFDRERGVAVRYGGLPMTSNDCVPETWEWVAETTAWRQVPGDVPSACDHSFLAYDRRADQTLLYGGGDDDGNLKTETWAWNGTRWRRLADEGPAGRAHFGFVYDPATKRPTIYGGYDGAQVFDDLWTWDGDAWTQQAVDDGPGARSHLGFAAGDGGLLVVGGADGARTFDTLTDSTWWFDGDRWTQVDGDGPSTRGSPALGYDEDRNTFVLYGGFDGTGNPLADTWEWNASDGWRCVAGC